MSFEINTKKICLFECDKPLTFENAFLNYSAGIWQWCVTPGTVIVTDDNGNTGYYGYTNAIIYNIKSLYVDGTYYLRVDELTDLETQDEAFFYNSLNKTLYVTFTDWEPFLAQDVAIGASFGYAKESNSAGTFYSDNYYPPMVTSISGIKKSKDPLFYGLLKFNTGTVKLINLEGDFDDWRERQLYKQPARILLGEDGDDYSSFIQVASGAVGEHSRSWSEFSVKFEDPRTVLSNTLPKNKLDKTTYPNLSDSNVDKKIPVAWGTIRNAPCTCLNEDDESASYYSFIFCDTEFNAVSSITEIKVDGEIVSAYSTNLTAGTFVLTAAVCSENLGDVTCSFVANSITNGVNIIKDIMANYADTPYISEYYDLTEMALAVTAASARNDSLYIKDETKVSAAIEKVCIDIDGLFFQHDSGLWTVRIYDEDREPSAIISFDEILDDPSIDGNEDEFLSSCIIKYNKNQSADSYYTYENKDYEEEVFAEYRALQSKTFETGLVDLASAQAKSESVMAFSKYIEDIVKIKVGFQYYDLEIMDFVICDPRRRRSGTDTLAVWEIIEISKDFNDYKIQLTLKYIKPYTAASVAYSVLVDESGVFIADESGGTFIMR